MLLNRAIQGELQVSFNYFLMIFHIFQIFYHELVLLALERITSLLFY